jgi:hypothetical protein
MNLKSFHYVIKVIFINKTVVDTIFITSSLKIECIQTFTKCFQNYCGLLTYFIKMATCVDHFLSAHLLDHVLNVVDLNFESP